MDTKNVIITGATGMVGGLALEMCLNSPDVSRVTAIGRRQTGIEDPKLQDVIVDDFSDFYDDADIFDYQDAALFCLGAYTGAVPDDLFRKITVDYTIAFAEALHKASPKAAFCFLSAQGADQTDPVRTDGSLTIALAGNPNCGKSALFNTFTGIRQKTGNWPGVTVDRKQGIFELDNYLVTVYDLPGI